MPASSSTTASAAQHREPAIAPIAAGAIVLLGFVLGRDHVSFDPVAVLALAPFLVLLVILFLPATRRWTLGRDLASAAGYVALTLETAILIRGRFGVQADLWRDHLLLPIGLPVAVIFIVGAAGALRRERLRSRRLAAVVLTIAFVFMDGKLLRDTPVPGIDVIAFQQQAAAALTRGQNPYALEMPNVYGSPTPYYSPEIVRGDRLTIGYPYPPLSLLPAVPSWWMTGDIRYAHLAAMTATVFVLALLDAGPWALLSSALLALLPDVTRVLVYGWTEPQMLPWLALTAWGMRTRRPHLAAVGFGLFLASKHTSVIFLPLLAYLVPRGASWRTASKIVGIALATASLVTLPFALWDIRAFWHSVVTFQVHQPFRDDGLTFIAWWQHHAGLSTINATAAAAIGFGMLLPAYAIVLTCGRRTPAGMGLAVAFVGTVFFAFNKQAFVNYYVLVGGALAIALAHLPEQDDGASRSDRTLAPLTPG